MKYRDVDKRLEALERDRLQRYDAWVRTLTHDELEAEIERLRRVDPDGWARAEAMTFEELDALINGVIGHAKH